MYMQLESQQQSISQQQIYSVLDSLELVDYETGYYEYINRNSNILLYQPQIILKFKNKSSIPIKGNVEISAIFIKGDEEWSNESSVGTYSLRITIKGTDIGQNGKGMCCNYFRPGVICNTQPDTDCACLVPFRALHSAFHNLR